jgi:hypothetical protein
MVRSTSAGSTRGYGDELGHLQCPTQIASSQVILIVVAVGRGGDGGWRRWQGTTDVGGGRGAGLHGGLAGRARGDLVGVTNMSSSCHRFVQN